MPILRPLLHALLCLALAANGIGAAIAGAHGACDHGDPATRTQDMAMHDRMHDGGHAQAPVAHHGQGHAAGHDADARHACCDDDTAAGGDMTADDAGDVDDGACGGCFCGCRAHAPAALPAIGMTLPEAVRIAIVQPAPTDHAAPALPHPTRPPIRQG